MYYLEQVIIGYNMDFPSSLVKKVEFEEKSINLDGLFNMSIFEGKKQVLSGGLNNISQFWRLLHNLSVDLSIWLDDFFILGEERVIEYWFK